MKNIKQTIIGVITSAQTIVWAEVWRKVSVNGSGRSRCPSLYTRPKLVFGFLLGDLTSILSLKKGEEDKL
ncbi:MAG TPA: hypothetical protein ENN79_07100 [Desulfobacteraceae bacterium]|nr:hypothetical protein [Desulfobacteraceae bacterium]